MLDQETLRSLIHYDSETGIMTWLPRKENNKQMKAWNVKYAGRQITSKTKEGYIRFYITFNGKTKRYYGHRFAWLYVFGEYPKDAIDHINRIKFDNRICNLRLSDESLNQHNRGVSITNNSGIKGVFWDKNKKKWCARIRWRGKRYRLGQYNTIEKAEEAYATASLGYAKEFSIYSEVRV